MKEIVSLAGVVLGALLFAADLVHSMPWLLLLGFVAMPVAFLFGITGGPAPETTARPGAKSAKPEQIAHLSADRRETQEAAPSDEAAEQEEKKNWAMRVLVVDDEANRATVQRGLRREDYQVVLASDRAEAIPDRARTVVYLVVLGWRGSRALSTPSSTECSQAQRPRL